MEKNDNTESINMDNNNDNDNDNNNSSKNPIIIPTDITKFAIETFQNGISMKIISEMLRNVKVGTNEFHHLMALKILSLAESNNEKYITELKKFIGFRFKLYLVVMKQNNLDINLNEIKPDSLEYMNYCEYISKLLWPVELPNDLQYLVLIIADHLLIPENMLNILPFFDENMTVFQYLCSIYEILIIFFITLEEFYKTMGINKKINFSEEITWCFDNPKNPLEKTISCYLERNPDIVTDICNYGKNVTLPMEKFRELVKQTYNFDVIIEKIRYFSTDKIMEIINFLDKDNKYKINLEFVCAIIVCDFIMRQMRDIILTQQLRNLFQI